MNKQDVLSKINPNTLKQIQNSISDSDFEDIISVSDDYYGSINKRLIAVVDLKDRTLDNKAHPTNQYWSNTSKIWSFNINGIIGETHLLFWLPLEKDNPDFLPEDCGYVKTMRDTYPKKNFKLPIIVSEKQIDKYLEKYKDHIIWHYKQ